MIGTNKIERLCRHNDSITKDAIEKRLHYDGDTGLFTRAETNKKWKKGMIVGTKDKLGYLKTEIEGKAIFLHRLAWLITYGEMPKGYIDHIDGNPSNNKIDNLRVCDQRQNNQNRRSANKNNKSGGMLGVSSHGKRFFAMIRNDKKNKFLGSFKTPEEAHSKYLEEKRKIHEFGQI